MSGTPPHRDESGARECGIAAVVAACASSFTYQTRIARAGTSGLWVARTAGDIPLARLELLDPTAYDAEAIETLAGLGTGNATDGGVLAEARAYFLDEETGELGQAALAHLLDVCDAESSDLEAVAARLRGVGDAVLDDIGGEVSRIVILDAVVVHEAARGYGIGRRVAAECVYAAGAWSYTTLVLAIAGAQVDPFDVEARQSMQQRAARLLDALGLREVHGTFGSVYVGHCGYTHPATDIFDLVHRR